MSNEVLTSLDTAWNAIQEVRPSDGMRLSNEDFVGLITRLSQTDFKPSSAFCFTTQEQVVLVVRQAPHTFIYTEVPVRGEDRTRVTSAIEGAGITSTGSTEPLKTLLSEFIKDLSFSDLSGRLRWILLFLAWGPSLGCLALSDQAIQTTASMVLEGLALFISVFVALGFERFLSGALRVPYKTLLSMFRADRYITILSAAGISAAMSASILVGLSPGSPHVGSWHPSVESVNMFRFACGRVLVGFSVLALLVCLLGLITHYLERAWFKVEGEATLAEYGRWKERIKKGD